ncbi:polyamine-modulated factor 1 [Osmerus mordax]|uniref:polyamine-modulated factor 1 n=1 Tax=Osmerus mordax TaxID=8014 RepID=UPI0035101D90
METNGEEQKIAQQENTNDQTNNATEAESQSTGPKNDSQLLGRPEPEMKRLLLFNKVVEKSLQKFIFDASFHRFARTFHPFYKKDRQLTENIHKQFIEDLQRTIQEDINKLIEEGELQCKLNELDKLEEKAKDSSEPAWRPSGVPEQDLCSFVMPYYLKQKAFLQQELKRIQKENAGLAQRVQAGREGLAQTEQRITAAVDEWKASISEFQAQASSFCPPDTFDV